MTTKAAGAVEKLVSEVATKVKGQVDATKKRFAGTHTDPKARPEIGPQHTEKFVNEAVDAAFTARLVEAFKADVQAAL